MEGPKVKPQNPITFLKNKIEWDEILFKAFLVPPYVEVTIWT